MGYNWLTCFTCKLSVLCHNTEATLDWCNVPKLCCMNRVYSKLYAQYFVVCNLVMFTPSLISDSIDDTFNHSLPGFFANTGEVMELEDCTSATGVTQKHMGNWRVTHYSKTQQSACHVGIHWAVLYIYIRFREESDWRIKLLRCQVLKCQHQLCMKPVSIQLNSLVCVLFKP